MFRILLVGFGKRSTVVLILDSLVLVIISKSQKPPKCE